MIVMIKTMFMFKKARPETQKGFDNWLNIAGKTRGESNN